MFYSVIRLSKRKKLQNYIQLICVFQQQISTIGKEEKELKYIINKISKRFVCYMISNMISDIYISQVHEHYRTTMELTVLQRKVIIAK